MLTKESLKNEFSKNSDQHYKVKVFEEEGLVRKKCPKCGTYFWNAGDKETCGDSSCEPYSFFADVPKADYIEMWRKFEKFFVDNEHASVPRYPVICRWRDDLPFTIASIVDFMRLEHGRVVFEYPNNPLVVPQTCLRFNDIPNVGVTGRHNSCFIMAGQHAFDYPNGGYWKDRCLELNYKYMTDVLEVPKGELTYKEDIWAMPDLSAFGPCIETFANGMEIVNSVFMQFRKTGPESYKELDMKVIDVGWGFERTVWYASKTPTAYDCIFGPVTEKLIKRSGVEYDKDFFLRYARISGALDMDVHQDITAVKKSVAKQMGVDVAEMDEKLAPIEALYAVADHSRALLFAFADGGLPSNVGGGYNLRVILRRGLSFIDKFEFPFSLLDVMEMHGDYLKPLFPEVSETYSLNAEILDAEEERYKKTLQRSRRIVTDLIKKEPTIPVEKLVKLYESNGITPELVEQVAEEQKIPVSLPSDFYASLTKSHEFFEQEKEEIPFDPSGLPKTISYYYNYPDLSELESKVVDVQGKALVLDKTIFYPEGGGQAADIGKIVFDGTEAKVRDVQKVGNVIFHVIDSTNGVKKGDKVKSVLHKARRKALTRHHTATHIINTAARKVLGNSIWQAGAKKDYEKAHLDVTFYRRITPDELQRIEYIANQIVLEDHRVHVKPLARGQAEKMYGFGLYQGGGSPGRVVRVVEIENGDSNSYLDAEACGGLHVSRTGEVGFIKIIKEERIQDGVNRIVFTAGDPAIKYMQEQEKLLDSSSVMLKVSSEQLPSTVERFFSEWKERGKEIDSLTKRVAELEAESLKSKKPDSQGVVRARLDLPADLLQKIAADYASQSGGAIVLANNDKDVIASVAKEKSKELSAKDILAEVLETFGGNGGGSPVFARGKAEKQVSF